MSKKVEVVTELEGGYKIFPPTAEHPQGKVTDKDGNEVSLEEAEGRTPEVKEAPKEPVVTIPEHVPDLSGTKTNRR